MASNSDPGTQPVEQMSRFRKFLIGCSGTTLASFEKTTPDDRQKRLRSGTVVFIVIIASSIIAAKAWSVPLFTAGYLVGFIWFALMWGIEVSILQQMDSVLYHKLAAPILGFMLQDNSNAVSKDLWIQINPSTLAGLPSEFDFMKEVYNYFVSFNAQPTQFFKSHQSDILQYTQSFDLTQYKNKVIDGNKVTIYKFKLNKKALRKAMIASAKETYSDGKLPAYEIKSIDQELSSINIKNGYFSVYANTTLPYGISGTIQNYDTYSKKISGSTDFNVSFTDFEKPLVVTPPDSYITILDFYNTYIKPSLETARKKGEEAALKSVMSSMRAEAEIVYDDNNGYGTVSNNSSCSNPTPGSVFNPKLNNSNNNSSYYSMNNYVSEMQTYSNSSACYSTTTAYAVSAKLPNSDEYFCVDSTGTAKNTTSQVTGTVCQ